MKRALFLLLTTLCLSPTPCLAGGLYGESTSTAAVTSYLRAGRIEIDNTYGKQPELLFTTEMITLIPGQDPFTKFVRRTKLAMTDPTARIPLLHPETGAVLGSFAAGDLYAMLYSAFVHAELQASAPATLAYTTNGN